MGSKVRIKLDKAQIIALMHTPGVVAEVRRQAERVAQRAGAGYEARAWTRRTKTVTNVVDTRPSAMSREARTGQLARAVSSLGR